MTELDNPETYRHFDPSGMLKCLHELPEQCQVAWQKGKGFELPSSYSDVDKVVLLGMGGSAIGGDLLCSLLAAEARVLLFVHRDYDLPSFVDAKTLVIASSYSGNTEETLSAFNQALETPSKKLAITTGGRLKAIAEGKGIPILEIAYSAPPRAALAHSFLSLIGLFQRLGFLSDKSGEVAEMLDILGELSSHISEGVPLIQNPAKQLATKLFGKLTVIYGGGILSEVAHRWKTQLNENSKAWAFYELFSELNHNAVVGYGFPKEILERIFVVLLRSVSLHPRTLIRYQLTAEILNRAGVKHEVVEAKGATPLSQMMSLVLFGDYVSYYLALLYKTDPYPVPAIDYLKEGLAKA